MTSSMLDAALAYGERGWRVFPVFGPKEQCPSDSSPGKTPRIKAWEKNASTSAHQIKRWWGMWPESNIGLCTGAEFVVLDIDGPHAEMQLRAREYEVPESLEVKTGKGRHIYLIGDKSIHNRTKLINGEPGVDIRGEGGYVVAPPSVHQNGRVYEFVDETAALAPLPAWMRELHGKRNEKPVDATSSEPITEGGRNDELARVAGSYRAKGLGFAEIYALLRDVNGRRCKPPLEDGEVRTIAESIARYPVNEVEIPQNWGWNLDDLKKRGADEETLAVAAKANDVVKKTLPDAGSDMLRIELKRKWSKDSSREVELVAVVTLGTQSCTVPKLRGRDMLMQETMAGFCYEQGLMLPKVKRAEWRKLIGQALAERHDEEVTEEETVVGACIVAARDWISFLGDTKDWGDFPSGNDRMRYAHGDGVYSVSAKQLRASVAGAVRDARRADISTALRHMGAFRHTTPVGKTVMLRVKLDNGDTGAKV